MMMVGINWIVVIFEIGTLKNELQKERNMEEKEENIDETTFKDGFTAIMGLLIVLGWKWNQKKKKTQNAEWIHIKDKCPENGEYV